MIQGVIFDADGTLLDSMMIWDEAGARYLKGLGIRPEPDLGKTLFSMTLEEGSAYLKKQYCLSETTEEIRKGVLSTVADFYRFEVQTKPGVQDFLQKLHEHCIPMVIATTGDKELLKTALKRLNIQIYFKQIFTCTEFNTSKKESYIYEKAAEYLHTGIMNTFVFEDALHALLSASKRGFPTVAVEDPASEKNKEEIKRNSDYYITDFSDFHDFWKFASGN